jgi:hypothetical protein
MKLGDLEFRAEDFTAAATLAEDYGEQAGTDFLNRLLHERLEKALIVYGRLEPIDGLYTAWDNMKMSKDTHTARLVCVEEIE